MQVSFFNDIVPMIFSLLAIVAVLYLCYALSKYLARRAGSASNSANIKILERVALSQDKGLVIAQICGAFYLIAFSSSSVEILKELDPDLVVRPGPTQKPDFLEIFNSVLKGRLDLTGNDRKHKIDKK